MRAVFVLWRDTSYEHCKLIIYRTCPLSVCINEWLYSSIKNSKSAEMCYPLSKAFNASEN